jgi:hypothetical protein
VLGKLFNCLTGYFSLAKVMIIIIIYFTAENSLEILSQNFVLLRDQSLVQTFGEVI